MAAHARDGLGGSTAKRTMNCPGWRKLARDIPKIGESSSYADEGTLLHNCAEIEVKGGKAPTGLRYKDQVLTEELRKSKLNVALDQFERMLDELEIIEYELHTEERVEFPGVPGAFGTADIILNCSDPDVIVVSDWKFGDGIEVKAENNDQLKYYGCGVIDDFFEDVPDDLIIYLCVVQPRFGYSYEKTTAGDLRRWRLQFMMVLNDEWLCVGDWCKFCPAITICPEQQGLARHMLDLDSSQLKGSDLSWWLDRAEPVEEFIKALRARAADLLENGVDVPRWKLVRGRKSQRWTVDEAELKKKFGDRVYEKVLLSVAKAKEKGLEVDNISEKVSTTTALVPASDKRPAITLFAAGLQQTAKRLT